MRHSCIARVWLVARTLRERKRDERITATTLARDLEVTTKTIHRDLDFLRDRLRHDVVYLPSQRTFTYQTTPLLTYL